MTNIDSSDSFFDKKNIHNEGQNEEQSPPTDSSKIAEIIKQKIQAQQECYNPSPNKYTIGGI